MPKLPTKSELEAERNATLNRLRELRAQINDLLDTNGIELTLDGWDDGQWIVLRAPASGNRGSEQIPLDPAEDRWQEPDRFTFPSDADI